MAVLFIIQIPALTTTPLFVIITDCSYFSIFDTFIFAQSMKRRAHRETAAPALFAFMESASSSGGLSVSRWACVPPRYGSGYAQTSQRKPIIRTHLLSEKGSDYMGLVRLKGLEPTRVAAREPKSRMSTNSITGAEARRRMFTAVFAIIQEHGKKVNHAEENVRALRSWFQAK